jgi:hypothetical protein
MCGQTACEQLKAPVRLTQIALPQLGLLVGELAQVIERPRVVDEDVDGAELLHRSPDCLVDLRSVGDIAFHRRRAPSHVADLLRGRLRIDESLGARSLRHRAVAFRLLPGVGLDLDVGDHDVCAAAAERQRVGAAEPS